MKKTILKRFITLLSCIFIFSLIISPVNATGSDRISLHSSVTGTDIYFYGKPWNHAMIYPEDMSIKPNVIIIYLHGDGNNGKEIEDLVILANIHHPLRYHREDILPQPDDTIFICPQTHSDGEFLTKLDELEAMISAISESSPDAKIILAGHESGATAAYQIASEGNKNIDGYVFISSNKPKKAKDLEFLANALVVYGAEDNNNHRAIFKNLFWEHDIADSTYTTECSFIEELSNNAYFVGPWNPYNAPRIFLEDFFWEWLNNLNNT